MILNGSGPTVPARSTPARHRPWMGSRSCRRGLGDARRLPYSAWYLFERRTSGCRPPWRGAAVDTQRHFVPSHAINWEIEVEWDAESSHSRHIMSVRSQRRTIGSGPVKTR